MSRWPAMLVLALIAGCAGPAEPTRGSGAVPPGPEARVEAGMSAEQVRAELGEPAFRETRVKADGIQVWYYGNGVVVVLKDGRVGLCGRAAVPVHSNGPEGGVP